MSTDARDRPTLGSRATGTEAVVQVLTSGGSTAEMTGRGAVGQPGLIRGNPLPLCLLCNYWQELSFLWLDFLTTTKSESSRAIFASWNHCTFRLFVASTFHPVVFFIYVVFCFCFLPLQYFSWNDLHNILMTRLSIFIHESLCRFSILSRT